jgi:hypothetical protein
MHAVPVPRTLLREVLAFMRAVYQKYKGEGVVMLYYCATEASWTWLVPTQQTSEGGLHVEYDRMSLVAPPGYTLYGSIHSHGNNGAFQSGTDKIDEDNFDGVHITLGNVMDTAYTIHVRFVASGTEWKFANVADLIEEEALPAVDLQMLDRVSKKTFAMNTRMSDSDKTSTVDKPRTYAVPRWASAKQSGMVYCRRARASVAPAQSYDDDEPQGQVRAYADMWWRKDKNNIWNRAEYQGSWPVRVASGAVTLEITKPDFSLGAIDFLLGRWRLHIVCAAPRIAYLAGFAAACDVLDATLLSFASYKNTSALLSASPWWEDLPQIYRDDFIRVFDLNESKMHLLYLLTKHTQREGIKERAAHIREEIKECTTQEHIAKETSPTPEPDFSKFMSE